MAVSIRDIAREAGVTVGTVSRALNNYPDVSPTTRERIVETAQRLGYHPNQMARNLSSKHNHNIALVLSGFLEEELINDFDAMLMKGCFHYTVNNDVEMSIQVINTKIHREADVRFRFTFFSPGTPAGACPACSTDDTRR